MADTRFKNYFKDKTVFTRRELLNFYLIKEPQLKENTFAWRIYNLKRKNIIKEVGRGQYSFIKKNDFILHLDKISKKIAALTVRNFKEVSFCISDSNWINEFSIHQYSNNFIVLEVEKEFLESVFYNMKEKFENIFIKPNEIELERYIFGLNNAIILIALLTRAPLQKTEDKEYNIPMLEKLIVDVFTKSAPYFFLTNSEITTIITNAFRKYHINRTTLLAYAERRGKKEKIKSFMIEKNLLEAASD